MPMILLAGRIDLPLPYPSTTEIVRHTTRADYLAQVVDSHAALILVDAADPDSTFWIVTPKTSPATRRIPIIVVTDSDDQANAAHRQGADTTVPRADWVDALPRLLDFTRRPPDADQLARQCADPAPPEALEAIRKFNAGEYYAQHDLLEALWMAEPGPVRDLYRAILQVGIAYYQIERGNRRGALKMLLRSVQWFALLPDVCQGVDVADLRANAAHVRAALEAQGDDEGADFDKALMKPVRMVAENNPP